jgi:hypothetical protein
MNFFRERLTMGMEAPLKLGSCITLPANIRKGWKEQLSSKCKALIQTPVLPKRGRGVQTPVPQKKGGGMKIRRLGFGSRKTQT